MDGRISLLVPFEARGDSPDRRDREERVREDEKGAGGSETGTVPGGGERVAGIYNTGVDGWRAGVRVDGVVRINMEIS